MDYFLSVGKREFKSNNVLLLLQQME